MMFHELVKYVLWTYDNDNSILNVYV